MQWCVALMVGLVDVGAAVHQFSGYRVLTRVTGHVKSRVPKTVLFIGLKISRQNVCIKVTFWKCMA